MSPLPEEFCRLCLRVDGTVSVFSSDCLNSWSLCDRIFECVSVKITENDVFPQTICTKCLQNVNAWCEFKTNCDRLQRTWFIWLKSVYGPREVVKKRIRDQARKRSLELGYWKKKDYLPGSTQVKTNPKKNKRPRNIDDNDCIIIDDDEDDESSLSTEPDVQKNPKRIRIESTHTLSLQLSKKLPLVENGATSQDSCNIAFDEDSRGQDFDSGNSPSIQSECNEINDQAPELGSGLLEPRDDFAEASNVDVNFSSNPSSIVGQKNVSEREVSDVSIPNQIGVNKDNFDRETEPIKEPVNGQNVSIISSPSVPQLKSLKSLAQEVLDILNGKSASEENESPERASEEPLLQNIWQPESLKLLVQKVLAVSQKESNKSDVPSTSDERNQSEYEEEGSQTIKTLKHLAQAVLNASKEKEKPDNPVTENNTLVEESCILDAGVPTDITLINKMSQKDTVFDNRKSLRVLQMHELQSGSGTSVVPPNVLGESPEQQQTTLDDIIGEDGNSRNNEDTEIDDFPVPSPVDSSQPESSSINYSTPIHVDYTSQMNIKEEPVSEDESSMYHDEEYDYSLYNYSIKTEQPEYYMPMTTISVNAGEGSAASPSKKKNHSCTICHQKLSSEKNYLRHLNSEIHRKMSSAVSAGRKATPELRRMWLNRIKAESHAKKCAEKAPVKKPNLNNQKDDLTPERKMLSLRRNSTTPNNGSPVKSGDTPRSNTKKVSADEDIMRNPPIEGLRECTLCKISFASRSLKVRHDSSFAHKLAVQKHEAALQPPSAKPVQQINQNVPQTRMLVKPINQSCLPSVTYACPFAQCGLSFLDGGQLIVHMHSHGISMPMKEVQDQIMQSRTPAPMSKESPRETVKEPSLDKPLKCQGCNTHFSKKGYKMHVKFCKSLLELNSASSSVNDVGDPADDMRDPSPDPDLICNICDNVCRNKRSLQYHMHKWHLLSKTSYKCPSCPRMFRSKFVLRRHSLTHRSIKTKPSLHCKVCKKSFIKMSNLQVHLRNHYQVGKGTYICVKCFGLFNKSEYVKHKSEGCSIKIKIFSCSLCSTSYNSQKSLDEHVCNNFEEIAETPLKGDTGSDIVTGEGTFCHLCNKQYSTVQNLKRHMQLHQTDTKGVRTFNCNSCSAVFSNMIMRSAHVCSPSSLVNFPAGTSDSAPETVSVSKKSADIVPKSIICRYCGKNCSDKRCLMQHMRDSCQIRNSKCVHCGYSRNPRRTETACRRCRKSQRSLIEIDFKQTDGIKSKNVPVPSEEVIKDEPAIEKNESLLFKCPLGSRNFLSQRALNYHIPNCVGTCVDLPVFCKVCHKKYENPTEYLEHKPCTAKKVGKSPRIKCQFCSVMYSSKKSLWTHQIKVHRYSKRRGFLDDDPFSEIVIPNSSSRRKRTVDLPESAEVEESVEEFPATSSNVSNVGDADSFTEPKIEPIENSPLINAHSVYDLISKDSTMCPACDMHFQSSGKFRSHVTTIHRNVFYLVTCPFCDKKLYKREMYEHGYECITSNLPGTESLECVYCNTIFYPNDDPETISSKLQHHIIVCGGKVRKSELNRKDSVMCLKCCSLFSSVSNLERHKNIRHNEKPSRRSNARQDISQPSSPAVSSINDSVSISESAGDQTLNTEQTSVPKNKAVAKKRTAPAAVIALEQGNLKCRYCGRSFSNVLKLYNHEKVHGIIEKNVNKDDETISLEILEVPDV